MKTAKKPTENPWISTAHELPPEGEIVEASCGPHVIHAMISANSGDWITREGNSVRFHIPFVTHWRHLPSAERVKIPRGEKL